MESSIKQNAMRVLEMELSYRCNLNCHHCFVPINLKQANIDMDSRVLAKCFDLVSHNMPDEVHLSGGEPLLHPQLKMIYHQLSTIAKLIVLETNGLLLKDFSEYAVPTKSKIVISVDGNEDTHNFLRNGAKHNLFNEILSHMALYSNRGFCVEARMVICKDNIGQIHGLSHILQDIGVNRLNFRIGVPLNGEQGQTWNKMVINRDDFALILYDYNQSKADFPGLFTRGKSSDFYNNGKLWISPLGHMRTDLLSHQDSSNLKFVQEWALSLQAYREHELVRQLYRSLNLYLGEC